MSKWTPFELSYHITVPMESGRFTGFFRKAPFDKPDVLRGFRGFRPSFPWPPGSPGEIGGEDYPWVDRQEPIPEGQALMEGLLGRTGNFFIFSACPVKKNLWHLLENSTLKKIFPHFSFPISNLAIIRTMRHCNTGRAQWDSFLVRLALGLSYSWKGKKKLPCLMSRVTSIDDKNVRGDFHIKIILIKV